MASCIEAEWGVHGRNGLQRGVAIDEEAEDVTAVKVSPIIKEVYCTNYAVQRYVKWGFTSYSSEVTHLHTG
jgi:hypothetical protein